MDKEVTVEKVVDTLADIVENFDEYLSERILQESRETLAEARWLAGHCMQFYSVQTVERNEFWFGRIIDNEKFYAHDWVGTEHVCDEALGNYEEALSIVAGLKEVLEKVNG